MSEDSATFYAPAKTSVRWNLSPTETFRALGRRLGLYARVTGVLVFGCFLLASLLALQVAALELSDRLNIFSLYGFFIINLICGLFLSWFLVHSRKQSPLRNQDVGQTGTASSVRLGSLWAEVIGALNIQKAESQSRAKSKPVAVLLIIKRQASVEAKERRHAASA